MSVSRPLVQRWDGIAAIAVLCISANLRHRGCEPLKLDRPATEAARKAAQRRSFEVKIRGPLSCAQATRGARQSADLWQRAISNISFEFCTFPNANS